MSPIFSLCAILTTLSVTCFFLLKLSDLEDEGGSAITRSHLPLSDFSANEIPGREESAEEYCRTKVFTFNGLGGKGPLTQYEVENACANQMSFGVCDELADFTGLSQAELLTRLLRTGRFHFSAEHMFWNPQTKRELAWYYSSSTSYLFGNAMHPAPRLNMLKKGEHEPLLDYSGGVGNILLHLHLNRGFSDLYYSGIGLMEKAFAEFRFRRRGLLGSVVKIMSPWTAETNWQFDPIMAPLPGDGSLGAILAFDVLEHIPNYELVVARMVESLRVGGVILERSPFAKGRRQHDRSDDVRIHVSNNGISMEQAMGGKMERDKKKKWWKKIAE